MMGPDLFFRVSRLCLGKGLQMYQLDQAGSQVPSKEGSCAVIGRLVSRRGGNQWPSQTEKLME